MTERRLCRAFYVAAPVIALALFAAGALRGDDRDSGPRLEVTRMSASCDGCAPDEVYLELQFDRDITPSVVAGAMRSEPPARFETRWDGGDTRYVWVTGHFAPRTTYRITLESGIESTDGATLRDPRTITVHTGSRQPRVGMPIGETLLGPDRALPLFVEAAPTARIRAVALSAADLDAAAAVTGVHEAGRDVAAALPAALRARLHERSLAGHRDDRRTHEIDPFALAGGAPALVILEAPGAAPIATVAQRGELAVTLKVGRVNGLVWVTNVRDGRPARSAEVAIYQGNVVRFRGRTDDSGLVMLPAESRLRLEAAPTGEEEEEGVRIDPPLRAVVTHTTGLAYASEHFATGVEPWQFGIPYSYSSGYDSLRGMITAERGIYRPGETVHLLGIVRKAAANGRLEPERAPLTVAVTNPDGESLLTRTVRANAYGTFRLDVALGGASPVGSYYVAITGPNGAYLYGNFEVGAYRANTFEVSVQPPVAVRGNLTSTVRASYLYGAALRGASFGWSARARDSYVAFESLPQFSFNPPWDWTTSREGAGFLGSNQATLDERGLATIQIDRAAIDEVRGDRQRVDVVVEATVTDVANDAVSGRTVHTLTNDVLYGAASDDWVIPAGRGWDVQVVATDPSGHPIAGRQIECKLARRRWVVSPQSLAAGARYDGHYEEVVVATRTVRSGTAPTPIHWDTDGGGDYIVRVGPPGQPVAGTSVWAYGTGASEMVLNHPRIELVSDRRAYDPGQTAHVYAKSPYASALALVTVEREGVLSARTMRLDGSSTPIDVAIAEEHAPNVYVSVAAVPLGLGTGSPLSGVPMRMGVIDLPVNAESRRLRVTLTPTETEVRPGERATVRVRVRDDRDRPVEGEVTIWAADEGVLALTGYQTPDPFEPAYARRTLAVRTASSLTRFAPRDPSAWYEGGGDGAGGPANAMRSRFLATAFFSRPVVTDARGEASVTFDVPDNLTRWRVMAAVADRGERFGKAEVGIVARKPLMVMPSIPRFLTMDDHTELAFVVHNHTGRAGRADVTIAVEGVRLEGETRRSVEIADGGEARVAFPVFAVRAGKLRMRVRAQLGSERDGLELEMPVNTATVVNDDRVAEGRVEGESSARLTMPSFIPGTARLKVTVASGVFASMERGLESLVEYPYGCLEQTTSRLVPMVMLEQLAGDIELAGLSHAEHRARMQASVDHVLRHQNEDGGFGLWPESASEPFLTAYGVFGLFHAREARYRVPAVVFERALAYLDTSAARGVDQHGQFSPAESRAFIAFVLERLRANDHGLAVAQAGARSDLTYLGSGLVAAALARTRRHDADALTSAILAARSRTPGGNSIVVEKPNTSGWFSYGSDVRSTAGAIVALVELSRAREADALVDGLLELRDGDGTWGTTYNNFWALYALTTYAKEAEQAAGNTAISVALGDTTIGRRELGAHERSHSFIVDAAELPAAGESIALRVVGAAGRPVRYVASLSYAVRASDQAAESHGLSVRREVLDAQTGRPVTSVRLGQVVRVRMHVTASEPRNQIAIVDRLPAGFEPIDTNLATTEHQLAAEGHAWYWMSRQIHDDRVAFFAYWIPSGTQTAEYLARVARAGEFVQPALHAEAMYDPTVFARGAVEHVSIR